MILKDLMITMEELKININELYNIRMVKDTTKNQKEYYSSQKVALITGITGQDGSYLAEFLLDKGYIVHGIKRRSSSFNTERIDHLYQDPHEISPKLILHYGDLVDSTNIIRLIKEIEPDEIYNLAAQSHVGVSFDIPVYTSDIVAIGTLRILECIKNFQNQKKIKFYQASSSEIFGKTKPPQNEESIMQPMSPYAISKLYSYWITKCYRQSYNLYASNGILFNHESPIRGETFVTRKITRAVSRIALGLQDKFYLGNLDSKRDWGHAKDYVEMQWLMLQQEKPKDYVISTGRAESVRKFAEISAKNLGWGSDENSGIIWEGEGLEEVGKRADTQEIVIKVDPRYFRPTEVDFLLGESHKAKQELGWEPNTSLEELIEEMIQHDKEEAKKESLLRNSGFTVNKSQE